MADYPFNQILLKYWISWYKNGTNSLSILLWAISRISSLLFIVELITWRQALTCCSGFESNNAEEVTLDYIGVGMEFKLGGWPYI